MDLKTILNRVCRLPGFVYAMRRVRCPDSGKVKVERVPWGDGKQRGAKALG